MKIGNSLSISDLRRLANRRLPRVLFEAIESGVEDELCIVRNEQALLSHQFLPRALVDIERRSQKVSLSTQFAKGDRHARRDAFWIADRLGADFFTPKKAFGEALAEDRQAILDAYVARQSPPSVAPSPVLAPPELLDDDTPGEERARRPNPPPSRSLFTSTLSPASRTPRSQPRAASPF